MRWKVRRKRPAWRRWFAWHPVIARTGRIADPSGSWVWLELIERRWVKERERERWVYRTRGCGETKTWGVARLPKE